VKASDRIASFDPPAGPAKMAAEEVPAVPEIEVALKRRQSGNYRNQFRGWLDEAGTVRVRVHVAGDPDALKGEILAGTAADQTLAIVDPNHPELGYFEYRDTLADNTLVRLWCPLEADHDGVKLIYG